MATNYAQQTKTVTGDLDVIKETVPVALPCVGMEEASAASKTVMSHWLSQGPAVQEFEKEFAKSVEAPYACAVSSCTSALHLALLAVGVKPGDVVITVSHSFIATANAIRHCQAEPYFIDISPDTFNMDPEMLEFAVKRDFVWRNQELWLRDPSRFAVGESPLVRIKSSLIGRLAAILVVHQVGVPADLDRLLSIAEDLNVHVIEDAACALGSQFKSKSKSHWKRIGLPHGDVACFSFHARKILTTGEGGMLTTQRPEIDRLIRSLRQHGTMSSAAERHEAKDVIFEEYSKTGYNYRMSDIQAAVGLEQLKKLDEILERRRYLASMYLQAFRDVPGIQLPIEPIYGRTNWQSFILVLEDRSFQRHVMMMLFKKGISTRRGIMCAHLEAPYAPAWPAGHLPNSERARDNGIILPLFHDMTINECNRVIDAIFEALN